MVFEHGRNNDHSRWARPTCLILAQLATAGRWWPLANAKAITLAAPGGYHGGGEKVRRLCMIAVTSSNSAPCRIPDFHALAAVFACFDVGFLIIS